MGQYFTLVNISKRFIFPNVIMKNGTITYNIFTAQAKMIEQLHGQGKKLPLALSLLELKQNPSTDLKNKFFPLGSWSGDRIVFIGDYNDGIPPFLTKAEGDELQAFAAAEAAKNGGGEGEVVANLDSFAERNYTEMNEEDFFKDKVFDKMREENFPLGDDTHHLVMNLDRKEYLDPTKFREHASCVDGFAFMVNGVMQGLYSLIFYSSGSGGGDVEDFMEGPWAGQRISIRDKDKVEDISSWKDISESVVESLETALEYDD